MKERDVTSTDDAMDGVVGGGDHAPHGNKMNGLRLDKRQIEQRIEEDRERHKRLRESIWAVSGDGDAEFDKSWEDGSYIADDHYVVAAEDAEERKQIINYG